jgi:hypothetical protein
MTCGHCIGGCVVTSYGETKCLACGWYLNVPDPSAQPRERTHCFDCREPLPYGYREMTCEGCKGKRKIYRQHELARKRGKH